MRRIVTRFVQRFVSAHIHGADGHRQTVHAFHGAAVGVKLLLFIGQMALPAHEQKLTAKQAHAHRAHLHGGFGVFGHFDIRQQFNFLPIERDGRCVAQAGQAFALQIALTLLETIFSQDDRRGVDNDHPGIPVDDDPVVLAHQLAGRARAHDRRDVQTSGHDGGMRSFATDVGHKANENTLLELDHVGRRQIVCDQNQRHIHGVAQLQLLLWARGGAYLHHGRSTALHAMQNALGHLLQVGLALTQVRVFHLIELTGNHFQLARQRPFGVVQTVFYPMLDAVRQQLVLQQHQMHVEQRGQFMRCVFGHVLLQALQFFGHRIARHAQTRNLAGNLLGGDEVVRHIESARRH